MRTHTSLPRPGLGLLIHQTDVNETHLTGSQEDSLTYVTYRPCLGHSRCHVKWHPHQQTYDLGPRPTGALSVPRSQWGKRRSKDPCLRPIMAGGHPFPTSQQHGLGKAQTGGMRPDPENCWLGRFPIHGASHSHRDGWKRRN